MAQAILPNKETNVQLEEATASNNKLTLTIHTIRPVCASNGKNWGTADNSKVMIKKP